MPSMANVFALLADECVDSISEPNPNPTAAPLDDADMESETTSLAGATIVEDDMADFLVHKSRKPKLTKEAKIVKAAAAEKAKAELIASGTAKKLEITQTPEEKQRQDWLKQKAERVAKDKAAWEARRAAYLQHQAEREAEKKAVWEANRAAYLQREARRQQKAAAEARRQAHENRKAEEAALVNRMTKASLFDYVKKA